MNIQTEASKPTKHEFDPVHSAQRVFRLFLEALANPGRLFSIGFFARQFAKHGQWFAPALTFLDNETGFFWNGETEAGEEIRFLTGAVPVSPEEADFVFLPAPIDPTGPPDTVVPEEFLARVKAGSHRDPHNSALLFIAAAPPENPCPALFLRGPGVPPKGRRIEISPDEAAWLKARNRQCFEYPQGVELVFIRNDGTLWALTRKVELSWL
jgi:phosphonate C-P lyase system protein PhnH